MRQTALLPCVRTLQYFPLMAGKRAETLLEMMYFTEMFTFRRAAELDFFGGRHSAASGRTSPFIVKAPDLHHRDRSRRGDANPLSGSGHRPPLGH